MLGSKSSERLLANIRNGLPMTQGEKLRLIVSLSVPSMLAQITTVMMFFIDAGMVGHLGAEASASIGLIESTAWLIGSVLSASAIGFSVQVSHFIGANDFSKARQVFRVCCCWLSESPSTIRCPCGLEVVQRLQRSRHAISLFSR